MATLSIGCVSRGIGAQQRRILDALIERRDNDIYDASGLDDLLGSEVDEVRARWRWYTIDLLGVVQFGAPRSERVSFHRAVHSLHNRGRLDIATACPYDQPFGAHENEYGDLVGGLDLSELSTIDPRWSSSQGRCLWFRLRVPPMCTLDDLPFDDQMVIADDIAHPSYTNLNLPYHSEAFMDFTGTADRRDAWASDIGKFMHWLLCGTLRRE